MHPFCPQTQQSKNYCPFQFYLVHATNKKMPLLLWYCVSFGLMVPEHTFAHRDLCVLLKLHLTWHFQSVTAEIGSPPRDLDVDNQKNSNGWGSIMKVFFLLHNFSLYLYAGDKLLLISSVSQSNLFWRMNDKLLE